ncbi:T9SS type A sorting domain-containing protein, partial [Bacteroidota bacterium]
STLEIITYPIDSIINEHDSAYFSIQYEGYDVTLQWQIKQAADWEDIIGTTNDTLHIDNVTMDFDQSQYRCIINDPYFSDTSDVAILTVLSTLEIISHPANKTIGDMDTAFFSIQFTGFDVSIQWQINEGLAWEDLNNEDIFNGVNNDTLFLYAVSFDYNQSQYRCIIQDSYFYDTSNAATLTINYYTFTGEVLTNNGLLNQGTVQLINTTTNVTITTLVDNGYYFFNAVPFERYYVYANPEGDDVFLYHPTYFYSSLTTENAFPILVNGNISEVKIRLIEKIGSEIKNEVSEPFVKVFPNPNTGIFYIEYSGLKNLHNIKIYDLYGKLLNEVKSENIKEIKIDLRKYPKGIYLIKIGTSDEVFLHKVLIK